MSHTPAVTAAREKPSVLCSRAKGSHGRGDRGRWGWLCLCPWSLEQVTPLPPHPCGGRVPLRPRARTGSCSSSHGSSRFSFPLCPLPGPGANAGQAVQPLGKEKVPPQEDLQPTLHPSPSMGHGSPITPQRALPQGPNSSPVRRGAKLGAAQPWHVPPRHQCCPRPVWPHGIDASPGGQAGASACGAGHFRARLARIGSGRDACGVGDGWSVGQRFRGPWSISRGPVVHAWLLGCCCHCTSTLHKHTAQAHLP